MICCRAISKHRKLRSLDHQQHLAFLTMYLSSHSDCTGRENFIVKAKSGGALQPKDILERVPSINQKEEALNNTIHGVDHKVL